MVNKFEAKDYEEICKWYMARDMKPLSKTSLPKEGFVVPGVAAAFLYKTDSDFCLFEGFVTNPKAHPKDRDDALDVLSSLLIKHATDLGYKKVFAISNEPNVIARAEKFGFNHIGDFKMLSKGVR